MISVAIVEDNDEAANLLHEFINHFSKKNDIQFSVARFNQAITFLSEYKNIYDIVFMDIEMPNLNGMDAALKLRKFDKQAVLIFVTNMAQYAVKGYEADALDFMIKPINYQDFSLKVEKAIKVINANSEVELVVNRAGGFVRISTKKLLYIEVMGHKLHYHTDTEVIISSGSLSEQENRLKASKFMRCNSCFLVNPKYIQSVQGYEVIMNNGDILAISRPKKKAFMEELADWLGQGNFI